MLPAARITAKRVDTHRYVQHQKAKMADAPSWQPLPPRRRKRQKSDTTPSVSAFEQKAKANAEAVAANVAQRAAAQAPEERHDT